LRSIFSESESKIVLEFGNIEKIWNQKPLDLGRIYIASVGGILFGHTSSCIALHSRIDLFLSLFCTIIWLQTFLPFHHSNDLRSFRSEAEDRLVFLLHDRPILVTGRMLCLPSTRYYFVHAILQWGSKTRASWREWGTKWRMQPQAYNERCW
jgi:hypothetical protein